MAILNAKLAQKNDIVFLPDSLFESTSQLLSPTGTINQTVSFGRTRALFTDTENAGSYINQLWSFFEVKNDGVFNYTEMDLIKEGLFGYTESLLRSTEPRSAFILLYLLIYYTIMDEDLYKKVMKENLLIEETHTVFLLGMPLPLFTFVSLDKGTSRLETFLFDLKEVTENVLIDNFPEILGEENYLMGSAQPEEEGPVAKRAQSHFNLPGFLWASIALVAYYKAINNSGVISNKLRSNLLYCSAFKLGHAYEEKWFGLSAPIHNCSLWNTYLLKQAMNDGSRIFYRMENVPHNKLESLTRHFPYFYISNKVPLQDMLKGAELSHVELRTDYTLRRHFRPLYIGESIPKNIPILVFYNTAGIRKLENSAMYSIGTNFCESFSYLGLATVDKDIYTSPEKENKPTFERDAFEDSYRLLRTNAAGHTPVVDVEHLRSNKVLFMVPANVPCDWKFSEIKSEHFAYNVLPTPFYTVDGGRKPTKPSVGEKNHFPVSQDFNTSFTESPIIVSKRLLHTLSHFAYTTPLTWGASTNSLQNNIVEAYRGAGQKPYAYFHMTEKWKGMEKEHEEGAQDFKDTVKGVVYYFYYPWLESEDKTRKKVYLLLEEAKALAKKTFPSPLPLCPQLAFENAFSPQPLLKLEEHSEKRLFEFMFALDNPRTWPSDTLSSALFARKTKAGKFFLETQHSSPFVAALLATETFNDKDVLVTFLGQQCMLSEKRKRGSGERFSLGDLTKLLQTEEAIREGYERAKRVIEQMEAIAPTEYPENVINEIREQTRVTFI
jgi:hypothetical protein